MIQPFFFIIKNKETGVVHECLHNVHVILCNLLNMYGQSSTGMYLPVFPLIKAAIFKLTANRWGSNTSTKQKL